MHKYTPDEIREAEYEWWVISGGRMTAQAKAQSAASDAEHDLEAEGWKIIEVLPDYKTIEMEYGTRQLVIRRKRQLRIIRWYPNQGWFGADGEHGNAIFHPAS